jgi:tetratricopeptide (TPR) repeat protein
VSAAARDTLLAQARQLREAGRIPEALATLDQLEQDHPRFSRLHQERGHCHVLRRDAPAAIGALRRAVGLNPSTPAGWDMLAQLYRVSGDAAQAAEAEQRLATLRQLPPPIVVANSLLVDGDLQPAEQVVRDFLADDPDNVGALRLLARVLSEQGALSDAEAVLARALERAPDYHAARLDYAMVLLQSQKPAAARREAEHLLRHEPDSRVYLKQYAAACVALGDHETVIDIYARLLADRPATGLETAELRLWRGNALKVAGRQAEAIADYRAALAARPGYGVAWFSLANLKTFRFSDDELGAIRAAAARPDLQHADRIYLDFALGKALEDRADYEGSWRAYSHGNALRRAAGHYRPEVTEAAVQRLRQTFSADRHAERAGWGAADPAPIFIVGLPRSGSTLVEQILASHPQVDGTQELTEIGRYAGELCGRDPDNALPIDTDALMRLTAADARALGQRFLADTQVYRRGRPFFIDKMPNNFWHIGLIHLILPNATVIDVRREPMACCFSNLKQLFGTTNQEFTYGVDDIARYYRAYLDLMAHWKRVLPGKILRVSYEELVDDLDGGVRRLLAHCGLPFDATCLDFHRTRRSIRTPSSEQVRQPIDRAGLDQWRRYAPWLGSLEAALGDTVTRYRD